MHGSILEKVQYDRSSSDLVPCASECIARVVPLSFGRTENSMALAMEKSYNIGIKSGREVEYLYKQINNPQMKMLRKRT